MSYTDLIRQEGEYTYSVNIQFDISSDTKLLRYIPNETSIELLREFFRDITRVHPDNHARILYGSYGTGKSHFLTVLGQILGKSFTKGIAFSTFIDRVSGYDKALAHDIQSYIDDSTRKPLLVVPIVFDFDDFDRCIYFSLKKKLDTLGISVHYKTFFDQALALLSQWRESPESYDRLCDACSNGRIELKELEASLSQYDPAAEYSFNKIFETMTFGVKYVYEASNMFEIMNQTNLAIAENYGGIVFIFDEFGRYIEDNLRKIRVKAIQDIAEYCDHCEGNNHILLVSHKEISQYTEHYGKNISSEWKKVEGRYKAYSINNRHDQSLSIIRSVLIKQDDIWEKFRVSFAPELDAMYKSALDFRGYAFDHRCGNPFEDAFPLHPLALFALDRLSKRVAQNDRTFFTYLASKESNSLYRFLATHSLDEFHYVGIDEIYDYFETSIKAVQSDDTYEWYKQLQSAIAKGQFDEFSDDLRVRILKVVATIGIINDPSSINADRTTILNALDALPSSVSAALDELCSIKILKYSGIYQRYEFFDASIFDISGMIDDEAIRITNEAVVKTLNDSFVNFVLYPHRYNRDYKISRIWVPVFSFESTLSEKAIVQKLGRFYDGALVMLLGTPDTPLESICSISKEISRSIIWLDPEADDLLLNVKKYIAAKYLETQKTKYISKDPAFEKELEYHLNELSAAVEQRIAAWKAFEQDHTTVVARGFVQHPIKSFDQVSELASQLTFQAYPDTLIVNNELINKNSISGSITSAKKNAIRSMLQCADNAPYYNLQYLSPDYIAVRSVLCKNGFISFNETIAGNAIGGTYMPQEAIKCALNEYIKKAQNATVPFSDIYSTLKAPPFGLRDGYLSLLFACVLMPYSKSLVISSHGTEQDITAELFEEIIRRPSDFSFTVAEWSVEEMEFIDALETLYSANIDRQQLSRNRLKAIYDGMLSHYKSVAKFSRTTDRYVSAGTKRYRKLLEKSHSSFTKFFFSEAKSLAEAFRGSVTVISESKQELSNALIVLSQDLKRVVCIVFSLDIDCSIPLLLYTRYKNEWEEKRVKSFDYYTNAFLDYVGKLKGTEIEYSVLCQLGKMLTGIEVSYWNDKHRDEFEARITEINAKLSAYCVDSTLQTTETRMTLTTASGEKTVVFDNTGLSDLSITIKNKINSTFGNFGLAVTYDDKVQVLLSLLSDLMEGK